MFKKKVDSEEIKRLGKRFKKLDIDGSGALSKEEFMQIADLQQNPLVQRVIDLFDQDGNGEVDFKEFIEGISQFSVRGDKEAKLKCILVSSFYNNTTNKFLELSKFFNVKKYDFVKNIKLIDS